MKNLHRIAPREQCWLTGNGELIPFTQLTNEHIHNIIWAYKIKPRHRPNPNRPRFWKQSKERLRMLEGVMNEQLRRKYLKLGYEEPT